jgi:spore coat polysaccharide biosynthesis protein SpsF (cytidylyltransferase family)
VSPYIREHPELFRQCSLALDEDFSDCRLTVDTEEDYLRAKALFEQFGEDVQFTDVVRWEKQNSL